MGISATLALGGSSGTNRAMRTDILSGGQPILDYKLRQAETR